VSKAEQTKMAEATTQNDTEKRHQEIGNENGNQQQNKCVRLRKDTNKQKVERSGRGNDVFNLLFAMSTTLLFFF
jgi:hypothetical protein